MERIKGANGELMKYSMQPMDGKGHLTLYRYDQLAVGGGDNAHLEFWIEIEELRKQLADAQATIAALQDERDGWVRSREHYYQLWMRATDERDEMRKERDEFESLLTQRTAECDALKLVNDTHMKTVMKLSHVVEQRTAELEAAKAIQAIDMKNNNAYREQVANLQAELEAVKQQLSAAQETILRTYTASAALDLVGVKAELERVSLLSSHNERRFEEVDKKYKELRALILALPKVEGAVVVSNGYVKDSTRCHALFGADEDAALYAALLRERQKLC